MTKVSMGEFKRIHGELREVVLRAVGRYATTKLEATFSSEDMERQVSEEAVNQFVDDALFFGCNLWPSVEEGGETVIAFPEGRGPAMTDVPALIGAIAACALGALSQGVIPTEHVARPHVRHIHEITAPAALVLSGVSVRA